MKNPVFCAIDTPDLQKAKDLAAQIAPHVGGIKLGLEFFSAHGPAGICAVAGDLPLFLDLKFHDIPNTVAAAVHAILPLEPSYITLHASGGEEMMRAAAQAAGETETPPKLLAVTVLTSLESADLLATGQQGPASDQVLRLAMLAQKSGMDGVVCSAHEIRAVRQSCGEDFTLMVPGIRPQGAQSHDQKRVMTPAEALKNGADYLVIGRPITASANPAQSAKDIAASLGLRAAHAC